MSALSPTNSELQRLRRLSGRRSARSEDGVYLIDGPVLLAEALGCGIELEAVYVEPEALNHEAVWAARAAQVKVREVTRGALKKVLDLTTPQDMVAVAPQAAMPVDQLVADAVAAGRPLLVLVELSDPGNAGTLIRVAEAAGCVGVVLTERTVDLYNPKTVRATAGAMFRVPVSVEADIDEVLRLCADAGLPTWATVVSNGTAVESAGLHGAGAFLIGSEAHGLSASVAAGADVAISIPMYGQVESLNAAVAGAVVLFDAARQRRQHGTGADSAQRTGGTTEDAGHNVSHDDRPMDDVR